MRRNVVEPHGAHLLSARLLGGSHPVLGRLVSRRLSRMWHTWDGHHARHHAEHWVSPHTSFGRPSTQRPCRRASCARGLTSIGECTARTWAYIHAWVYSHIELCRSAQRAHGHTGMHGHTDTPVLTSVTSSHFFHAACERCVCARALCADVHAWARNIACTHSLTCALPLPALPLSPCARVC